MKDSYPHIFLTFLRFGLLAWGGPVAQISMIKDELVEKRNWITPEKFRRVLAVYQALPGPEAHEICVYFGMIRAGRLGGFLAGLGFMLPGLLLILLLSWCYQNFGSEIILPIFVGVAPAVTALIARAAHRIGKDILVENSLKVVALISIILSLLKIHFLIIFIVCAGAYALWVAKKIPMFFIFCIFTFSLLVFSPPISLNFNSGNSSNLFFEGLKAGLLSFGGAYTAIPFLQESLVGQHAGITQHVFLDSIALGAVIPAPLIIFGTFLGFIADGFSGAILMTIGIFLPAFSFTLLAHHQLERIIENHKIQSILDAISAAVVGILVVTAFEIFRQVITGWGQFVIFAVALYALYFLKNNKWIIPVVIVLAGLLGRGIV